MLNMVQTICQDNGISRYQLEVIQENTAAVALYKKQGFQVMRSLNCYMTERSAKGNLMKAGRGRFFLRRYLHRNSGCVRKAFGTIFHPGKILWILYVP